MVRLLLSRGANINAFDKKDRRAIHWAAYMVHIEEVKLLASHGSEVSCKDKKAYTPLHSAAFSGMISTVKQLLDLGVDVNQCIHTPPRIQLCSPCSITTPRKDRALVCWRMISFQVMKIWRLGQGFGTRGWDQCVVARDFS
ncbi:serine/threonine-protein phosphatase 6 regulatory ankyrin repeat subunit A-like [Salmo salar]|uniref:Serine/threonine-protein phosphatase 6 regulatory ankyrin repeat subunit A-like n=1 Tax=Salmo salar TaxID=8030 RepID=A0A1S3QYU6_SALSA|nr:serine/threonine-protein phosphatase 6 regulatory ankyrin repeat subunit A-like [Salmo salar]